MVKGSTKKMGVAYSKVIVVLYNKENLQPIMLCKPDKNGDFNFSGLNTIINCFCIAFSSELKNARVFDKIKPE